MGDVVFSGEEVDFFGFDTDTDTLTKPEILGEQLLTKLWTRDPKFGGVSGAFWGLPGSGKTSLMLQICERITMEHPKEVIFWREPYGLPMQILNLGVPVNIFTDSSLKIKIWELTEEGKKPTKDFKSRIFHRPASLLNMVEPGINVIYFKKRDSWLKLIERCQENLSWQSFMFDEAEDIFSSRSSGQDWYLTDKFTTLIKDLRKARISLYVNSQVDWDLDSRIKTKILLECFMYGSRKDKNTPLYRGLLQSIDIGDAWITFGRSVFGMFSFDPVTPREKQYIAIPYKK